MTQDPRWDGESRKIDAQFFRDYLGDDLNEYTFLVAGPPGMVEGMQEALAEAGVKEENVIPERYSGY
jgi:NAD(P)H-flavin reductase